MSANLQIILIKERGGDHTWSFVDHDSEVVGGGTSILEASNAALVYGRSLQQNLGPPGFQIMLAYEPDDYARNWIRLHQEVFV
jgi:hypothetical protein